MELFENGIVSYVCKRMKTASVVFDAYQNVANRKEKDFFSGLRPYFQRFSVFRPFASSYPCEFVSL